VREAASALAAQDGAAISRGELGFPDPQQIIAGADERQAI
jgi:hypothetical protein